MDIPIELAVGLIGASLALVLYAFLSSAEDKSSARETLARLDGYGPDIAMTRAGTREHELSQTLAERLTGGVLGGLTKVGHRFTPVGYVESTKKKFKLAGKHDPHEIDRFLALRVTLILAIPFAFWFFFLGNPLNMGGIRQIGGFGTAVAWCALGQDMKLNKRIDKRRAAIVRQLPDILDLLVISVEAGLGFEQALDRTIGAVPGVLSDEFRRMLNEIQAGVSRADAMRALEERVGAAEFRSFVLAILQADTFGVSIGRVLRAQADEMRIRRRQIAQEKAMKAPVKMLIPMVFCIFPALFVVVIGPAVINIKNNF